MFELNGYSAIVTGGARGLGAAIVQALGWDVAVLAPAATCGEGGAGGGGEQPKTVVELPRAAVGL